MIHLKGSHPRVIRPPGYHLHSKYDLHGLREIRTGGHHKEVDVELPLTSMIDMFSMLVIFLLINFSASGDVFFINKKMTLPNADYSHQLENFPLVSVSKEAIYLDAHLVGENPLSVQEPTSDDLPKLREGLRGIKRTQMQIKPNEPFKGQINVQSDKDTPVIYIKRIMATLISEGFTGINFAVVKK